MGVSKEQIAAGQAVYTKRMLSAYDFLVLGISNSLIWKCPSQRSWSTTTGTSAQPFGCWVWDRLFPRPLPVSVTYPTHRVDGPEPELARLRLPEDRTI